MVRFVTIPGGSVTLHDARTGQQRTVALRAFDLATTTVSDAEFASHTISDTDSTGLLPATGVRWRDVIAWCNRLSLDHGRAPAYEIFEQVVRWDPAADGYRLPTEAEWVHASRASTDGPRYGPLGEIGWSADDDLEGPQPTGAKRANDFGLYDTIGNVWEWCWDRLDPARYGDYRVFKGGGWSDPAWSCRVGVRRGNAVDAVIEDVGFRLARGAVGDASQDGAQGWSASVDRARASSTTVLPIGWTPLDAP